MKAFEHPSADRIKYGVKYGVNDGVNDGVKVGVKLSETQKRILNLIMENENITREGLSEKIGISIRNTEKNIAKLKEKGFLIRIGPDKVGYWKVEDWPKGDEKDGVKDGVRSGVKDGVKDGVKLSETQKKLLNLISEDKNITRGELSEKIGISIRNIEKNLAKLKEKGLLIRMGSDKVGYWKVENWSKGDEKDGVKDGVNDGVKNGVKDGVKLSETQKKLINLISEDKNITRGELSEKIGISIRNIEKNIAKLKEKGLLIRIGSDKVGYWKVLTDDKLWENAGSG